MRKRTTPVALLAAMAVLALADAASAYYSPRLGRFLSRDPLNELGAGVVRQAAPSTAFIPRDPLGEINPYGMVGNNPANNVDPLGLKTLSQCKYQCGQCWMDCRKSNTSEVCDRKGEECHASCERTGEPTSECGGTPLPPSPGTPMPPPATIPWYVGGDCACANILECMGRCLAKLKAAETAIGTSVVLTCGQIDVPKKICGIQMIPQNPFILDDRGRLINVCGGAIIDRLPLPKNCQIIGGGAIRCVGRTPGAPIIIGGAVAAGYEAYCAGACYKNPRAY